MPLLRRRTTVVEAEAPPEPAPSLPPPPAANAAGLRTMADHREYLLSLVEPLEAFGMNLLDAWGLALCEDIASPGNLPPFDNSQMDGYAVRAADVIAASEQSPVVLGVAGAVAAGDEAQQVLPEGAAVKVMTGAPLPAGTDAVLPYEHTDRGEQQVRVHQGVAAGQYLRRAGSDVTEGTTLAVRGQRVDARIIGLLAGAGIDTVLARPRPRVVVVSTGAELVEPGRPLTRTGQVHDANASMIAAAAKAEGCQVWRVQVPSDDPATVREAISDQLIRADLLVTTGGVSQGDFDVVKQVMPSLGACDFAEVAMQPGKPQGCGLVGEERVPVVMLPGNPVSAYVSFQAFVRPLVRRLMGITPVSHPAVRCTAGAEMRSVPGKLQFGRALVEQRNGQRTARLVGGHSSHLLGDLAACNALVLLPEDVELVRGGEPVMCWMLDHD